MRIYKSAGDGVDRSSTVARVESGPFSLTERAGRSILGMNLTDPGVKARAIGLLVQIHFADGLCAIACDSPATAARIAAAINRAAMAPQLAANDVNDFVAGYLSNKSRAANPRRKGAA